MVLFGKDAMGKTGIFAGVFAGLMVTLSLFGAEGWCILPEPPVHGIHVASYRDEGRAEAQVRFLEDEGHSAFSLAVSLPGQGDWRRVFAGYHKNRQVALEQGEVLKRKGIIERFSIITLDGGVVRQRIAPEAPAVHGIHVASFRDEIRAEGQVRLLKEAGLPAFSLSVDIPGRGVWHRVFAGFHENRDVSFERGEALQRQGIIERYSLMVLDEVPGDGAVVAANRQKRAEHSPAAHAEISPKGKTVPPRADARPPVAVMPPEATALSSSVPVISAVQEPAPEKQETVPAADPVPTAVMMQDEPQEKEEIRDDTPDSIRETTSLAEISLAPGMSETRGSAAEAAVDYPVTAWEKDPAVQEGMAYLRANNYGAALEKFQDILKRDNLDGGMRNFLSRRAADCTFELALQGGRHQILAAIDGYRQVLRASPDPAEGNDEILIRMAEGYHFLGLYYEGLRELNRLYESYPRSSHADQALYMRGVSHYRMQRYDRAAESFKEYLAAYPAGAYKRPALFSLGDSYSHQEDYEAADEAFNRAIRLWPSLEAMPRQELLLLGTHYMRSGDYDRGLEVFLAWYNLYPETPEAREVLYGAARILAAMEEVPAALGLLARILERYPESRQAQESMIIMAGLGLQKPGRSLPRHIFDGMEYYLNPIYAFDEVLMTSTERARREELLFQKVEALMKLERYREAFESAHLLQVQSPWGPYRKENMRNLVEIAQVIIDGYYNEGDLLAAADVFLMSRRFGITEAADFESLYKAAKSLDKIGLAAAARTLFENLHSRFTDTARRSETLLALAAMDMREGSYQSAQTRAGEVLARAAVKDNSPALRAREILGDSAFRRDDFDQAARYYAELAVDTSAGNQARIVKKHGDTLKALRRYSSAITQYARAIEIGKNHDDADAKVSLLQSYEGIAECYYRQGLYEQSVSFYRLFLDNASRDGATPWGLYRLGQSYARLSNTDMAMQTFDVLKEKAGDPFWVRVADYGRNYESLRNRYGATIAGR